MCGRFTSLTPPDELAAMFEAEVTQDLFHESFQPDYNVAPSKKIYTVAHSPTHGRLLGRHRWGLIPAWAKEPRGTGQVNARRETIAEKPSFRDSFRAKRCLIPMSGYYEWRTVFEPEKDRPTEKTAVYITAPDGEPFAVAGLWSSWADSKGAPVDVLKTCCVVTTQANSQLAGIHDRMPVLLAREDWPMWLGEDPSTQGDLLALVAKPFENELAVTDVGSKVNSVRNNGPELVERVR